MLSRCRCLGGRATALGNLSPVHAHFALARYCRDYEIDRMP